ncbi:MAG: hypothetical protein H7X89_07985, partial [Rhizobiales bacterium]|nr:hypothetical protein [Hyphomicrobiales bacterium]
MTGGKTGTALAEVIFEQVKRHAGLAHWPVQLVPHDSVPDEYEGTNSIRPVHDRKAAGT